MEEALRFDNGVYFGAWFDLFFGTSFWCLAINNRIRNQNRDAGIITHFQVFVAGILGLIVTFGSTARVTPRFFSIFRVWQLYSHCVNSIVYLSRTLFPETFISEETDVKLWRMYSSSAATVWLATGVYFFVAADDGVEIIHASVGKLLRH
mmetsp:Transcript_5707/g.6891  ORF Transcript_5707/g.6891 Transcript_5707/m.6891 type:complete len:150 (-) Transcript_5707:829-1278(-)